MIWKLVRFRLHSVGTLPTPLVGLKPSEADLASLPACHQLIESPYGITTRRREHMCVYRQKRVCVLP